MLRLLAIFTYVFSTKTEGNMTKEEKKKDLIEKGKPTRFKSGADAAAKGRAGGIKSGEVRREKAQQRRDAREAARYILGLRGNETSRSNLYNIGAEEDDSITNMEIMMARLWVMGQSGNLEAMEMFMKYAGYEPKENRSERESIAADHRRDLEIKAKLEALGQAPDTSSISINMNDEDGNDDVVFYIPQMLTEEECQIKEDETAEDKAKSSE